MTNDPRPDAAEEATLTDDEMSTDAPVDPQAADADGTDADGADGDSTDGVDGDSTDGADADGTDGADADGTDA